MNASPPRAPADEILRRAIENCAREPIERPGAVQSAGMLLVLDADGTTIRAASANAPARALPTDPGSTGGGARSACPLVADALGAAVAAEIGRHIARDATRDRPRATLAALVDAPDGRWTGTLVSAGGRAADGWLVELEAVPAADAAPDGTAIGEAPLLEWLNGATEGFRTAADAGAAASIAAEALRALTGFDRVMAYRFDADWSGLVLAEARGARDDIGSFAGLRFPASDIPAQARALYASEPVRLIPDAAAPPVKLVGPGAGDLDLTRAALRAVSPVHLAYLANMGVRASMSVAVRRDDGRLWGLLACHHQTGPLHPKRATRAAAELLARALASRIASLEGEAAQEGRLRVAVTRERLASGLVEPDRVVGASLSSLGPDLARALAAARFVVLDGERVAFAHAADAGAPTAAAAVPAGLVAALERVGPDGALTTDHVASSGLGDPADELAAHGLVGIAARRVTERAPGVDPVWAVWLRPERRQEVSWAGVPEKRTAFSSSGAPMLSPRQSFAAWIEDVRDRSSPFGDADRAAADAIADAFGRALARRSATVARAHAELRTRNEQIRFFVDALVHDLREPLWQIQVFAGMLQADLDGADAAGRAGSGAVDGGKGGARGPGAMAAVIESSAGRMRDMVDELSRFALAGADPERQRPHDVAAIVAAAEADLAGRFAAAGTTLARTIEPGLTLVCDGGQIRRLVQNLLSNALKFRRPDVTPAVALAASREGDRVVLRCRDDGVGFAPADRERIFEPFRRLAAGGVGSAEGLGLGLAICRRIVEAHGGRIEAEGVPGRGASFTISLPEGGPPP